ncbi:MAG: hypothetical protein WA977_02865 [Halobacteriota archaeon]
MQRKRKRYGFVVYREENSKVRVRYYSGETYGTKKKARKEAMKAKQVKIDSSHSKGWHYKLIVKE